MCVLDFYLFVLCKAPWETVLKALYRYKIIIIFMLKNIVDSLL